MPDINEVSNDATATLSSQNGAAVDTNHMTTTTTERSKSPDFWPQMIAKRHKMCAGLSVQVVATLLDTVERREVNDASVQQSTRGMKAHDRLDWLLQDCLQRALNEKSSPIFRRESFVRLSSLLRSIDRAVQRQRQQRTVPTTSDDDSSAHKNTAASAVLSVERAKEYHPHRKRHAAAISISETTAQQSQQQQPPPPRGTALRLDLNGSFTTCPYLISNAMVRVLQKYECEK